MFYLLPYVHVFSYLPTFILKERVGESLLSCLMRGIKQKKEIQMNEFPFLKRCLAESNRSTRFCRPLPNRSVKTPFVSEATISELRVQRYNFYLVPPNFLATFFKKTFIFCCFSLLLVYFLLFFPCFHSFLLTLLQKWAIGAFIVLTRLCFPVSFINAISGIHYAYRQY